MGKIFQNFNEWAGIVFGGVNVLSNFAADCWHAIPVHDSALNIMQASNRICGIVPAHILESWRREDPSSDMHLPPQSLILTLPEKHWPLCGGGTGLSCNI
jgi:hypothetical protein